LIVDIISDFLLQRSAPLCVHRRLKTLFSLVHLRSDCEVVEH